MQFHRYKQTPVKVTSTKYAVVISSTTSFRLVDVYMCLIVFTTTIDAILFLRVFQKNSTRYHPKLRCWKPEQGTPTEPTGPPVHQKIHLDKVCTRLVPQLTKKNTMLFKLKVNVSPYCTIWLMVY